ncbi:MAG: VanZ family protein [Ruminococcaceae bacterium]|nr:VanZ family protein [Oscillospiraceae bacterium]
MIRISYGAMILAVSIIWCMIRVIVALRNKRVNVVRELQLLLVYVCIVVIIRFTFCPFETVDGKIQPLLFDSERILPLRINLIPFVYLFDYETVREIMLNLLGNSLMFVPVGIVYPIVYKKLNTHVKVIAAGIGFSLAIELLQLPFFDRVSDVDDLILNSLGYLLGYLIYLLVKRIKTGRRA